MEGRCYFDPRIAEWLAEDEKDGQLRHVAEVAAARARLAKAVSTMGMLDPETPEWIERAEIAIGHAKELGLLRAAGPLRADETLDVLIDLEQSSAVCAPEDWWAEHMEETRLSQLVEEGCVIISREKLRFSCEVRMGGYKYQDVEEVEDAGEFPEVVRSAGTVSAAGDQLGWDEVEAHGDFDTARRAALDDAKITEDSLYDRGDDWDSMAYGSAWVLLPIAWFRLRGAMDPDSPQKGIGSEVETAGVAEADDPEAETAGVAEADDPEAETADVAEADDSEVETIGVIDDAKIGPGSAISDSD